MKPTICLVSPSHLANNPRLVKEADALHTAGYDVHVVCGSYYAPILEFDAAIRAASPWKVTTVDYAPRLGNLIPRLRHRWARRRLARDPAPTLSLALVGQHRVYPALAAAAARVPAALYIGHTVTGLAAAAHAARTRSAAYAFDAEDFHPAETDASENDPAERAVTANIERALLPSAAYITAASPLIGEAYAETYGLPRPRTVLNVFPLNESPSAPRAHDTAPTAPRRLYWFSQTVGPGRGLEEIIAVLARLRTPTSLHLRGLVSAEFAAALRNVAAHVGYVGTLEFLPMGPASEMARLAAPYDVGLSLEQTTPHNRDLCLTNKIFTYLLAGLPILCTPTRAQQALAADLGPAALLVDLTRPAETAAALDAFFSTPDRLHTAAAAAWHTGHTRYHWDYEQRELLAAVAAACP